MANDVTRRRPRWLPELLEDFPWEIHLPGGEHVIRVEESTEEGAYVVRAELPGLDPAEDVEITVQDRVLTVHAERSEEERTKHHSEFRYGSFTRSVQLPAGAREDDITAAYDKGILTVTVPLAEAGKEPRKIRVGAGG
ncbi:Hsp20/alpha crystallin family protein [Streptomyces sp. HPF1205]|uniref:Hsp20/alpha crystallin family protein n=1 Tax=Streptomyces sp. HPF1205 TaxID=2873262 RepID=UPI001CECE652|nr:Hsp20/alpha crystallin family protein [Streptomyces sp. HPF1205]